MADIETKIVDRESIMGVKTAKKTITKKKAPIKKAKKKISGPKPAGGGKKNGSAALPPVRLSWGGRMDRLEEALELQSKQTAASEAMLTEKIADMAASVKDLGLNVGGINNSIGKVVEMVLLPGLMEKLNTQFGYQFDNISPNKIFTAGGKQYAEVDLFLENGDAVMAVEAKTVATKDEVIKHVSRIVRLREHETKAGLTGKTIYAAMAGITFDADARELARASGMYLVELDHSNALITIEPPAGAVGKW